MSYMIFSMCACKVSHFPRKKKGHRDHEAAGAALMCGRVKKNGRHVGARNAMRE